jgi:hypothetical protein
MLKDSIGITRTATEWAAQRLAPNCATQSTPDLRPWVRKDRPDQLHVSAGLLYEYAVQCNQLDNPPVEEILVSKAHTRVTSQIYAYDTHLLWTTSASS